jgi:hypothetical protein
MRHTIHEFWFDDQYYIAVFSQGALKEIHVDMGFKKQEEVDIPQSPGVVKALYRSLEYTLEIAEDSL